MKIKVKLTSYLIIGVMIFVVIFFFWASSPNYSLNDYSKLIINNHPVKFNKDSVYSIITYNIGYLSGMTNNKAIAKPKDLFDKNLEKVKKEFRLLNSDFIAFQEIDYASARSYKVNQQNEIAELGYNFLAQAINWDETYVPFPYWPPSMHFGRMLSGQSILSKYPLKNHQRQLDVVIDLFNKYKNDYPTILLGDFNSDIEYENPAINKILTLDNIGNAAFESTYDFSFSSANPFKRIDYIFYSKNSIELIESRVLKQFGEASDHLPIEMKFRLK